MITMLAAVCVITGFTIRKEERDKVVFWEIFQYNIFTTTKMH